MAGTLSEPVRVKGIAKEEVVLGEDLGEESEPV